MWDSAKKPIKVRSVLQPNGMRHFIVNEDNEEIQSRPLLQQRKNSNKTVRSSNPEGDTFDRHQSSNERNGTAGLDNGIASAENHKKEQNRDSAKTSCPLLVRSNTLNDADDRWATTVIEHDRNFFGVSGSKISNSKKHKGQHSRYIHQFPHATKSNVEFTKYPHLSRGNDVLDLVPVKSPVIKKLISGRINSSDYPHEQLKNQRLGSNQREGQPPTTLCSRIMTWIDLEVKRNAGKGKSSLPYNATSLDIVNELVLPGDYDQSKINALLGSNSDSSSNSSSSSESTSTNSGTSTSSSGSCSSPAISLPKLTPCWRKDGNKAGNKTKKSVRIAEDLPRWGNMKRRLRRKTLSLNELYEEEPLSYPTYYDCSNKTDYISNRLKGRKEYCSVTDLAEQESKLEAKGGEDTEENKTDSFLVCDERLLSSGKLQVHIFLPQTESACTRLDNNFGNLSARSEDSTS